MRIMHSEIYALSADAPECVIDIIRQRLKEKYAEIKEERYAGIGTFLTARNDSDVEEGKHEGHAISDFISTNGDDESDRKAAGADGYLGLVSDTGGNTVRQG